MKILILGAHGQVGSDLVRQLSLTAHEVHSVTRADLDFANDISATLSGWLTPDILINCVAYNRVDDAEGAIDLVFRTNAFAVREIAIHCQKNNILLIHFSTDYVFGPNHKSPIGETAALDPLSVYGASKASGDFFARNYCSKHIVLRVSSVFGAYGAGGKGGNFIETMIRLAKQNRPISVVNDQFMSPTHSLDIAKSVVSIIQNPKIEFGIYNCTSQDSCTWFDFASEIFRSLNLEVDVQPITAKEFGSRARRPHYSVLKADKLNQYYKMPEWHDALAEYLQIKGHLS